MRYLRMLSNSVAAGAVATSYVLVLVLQLNPDVPLDAGGLQSLVATIGQYYLLHLTAVFYVVLVATQLLARELFSPAWISVGVQARLGAAAAAAGATLMWANIRTFELMLAPDTVAAMTRGAGVFAMAALALAAIAVVHRRSSRSGRLLRAAAVAVVVASSLGGSMAARGAPDVVPTRQAPPPVGMPAEAPDPGAADRSARVTIIAIDAGSLDLITSATAEGRLPNFGRILDAGAVMHLATLRPTSAPAIWTAVATGKLPQKNGIRSAGLYRLPGGYIVRLLPDYCFASGLVRLGFLAEEPHAAQAIRTRTLWSILSSQGVETGVVNWPLTYPSAPMRGYLVTDLYARLALTPLGLDDPLLVYPPPLHSELLAALRDPFAPADTDGSPPSGSVLDEGHRSAVRLDRVHDRLLQQVSGTRPADVTIVRYESLDHIGHYFLRYAMPSTFGDVSDDERRRFGRVLEDHYGFIDNIVGRAIAALDADDLLLVVSGYGMEPLGFGKRLVERVIGDPEVSGTHELAPDGFLMAYGAAVGPGRHLTRGSVVDVVPTALYFLGLPVGRDMDGFARTGLFRADFASEHPVAYIPSYE
jgi:hypothetical protein